MLKGLCWKDGCNTLTNFVWVEGLEGKELREFFACSRLHAGAFAEFKVFDNFEGEKFREISSKRSIESELVEDLDLGDLEEVESFLESVPSSPLRAVRVLEEIRKKVLDEEKTPDAAIKAEPSDATSVPSD